MTRTPEQEAAFREYHRKYRSEHREKSRAYAEAYRNNPANAEKIRVSLEANREKRRLYAIEYYKKYPDRVRESKLKSEAKNPGHRRRYKRKILEMFNLVKMDRPCYDCGGVFPPEVMDWDHLPGTKKCFSLNKVASHGFDAVLDEIAKCQLVCSNCHRLRTRSRKEGVE